MAARIEFHPLTSDRWADLEALFGQRGACGGCWCMTWRLPRAQFERQKGEENRQALRQLVRSSPPPGVLAYAAGQPVGWVAVAPRSAYPALERSRVLQPVDEQPVWSVTCFFIARPFRRQGLSVKLLKAAVEFARGQGATIVEGYPVEPYAEAMPDAFAWVGTAATFKRAGFHEALRRSKTRPIMRFVVGKRSRGKAAPKTPKSTGLKRGGKGRTKVTSKSSA